MILIYIEDFFQLTIGVHMLKHSKGENVFSKYMNRKLLCFHVYGYYKGIIKVLKNTNKIFTLCEQSAAKAFSMFLLQNWP
jgi:hypothetical protein